MTAVAGGETYSLPEIQAFYASESPALHGTSPDVYAQNRALVDRIQSLAADRAGYPIMGVQLLGSRANGSAGLNSDADMATVHLERFDDRRVKSFDDALQDAVKPIHYDSWGAMAMHHIVPNIPTEPVRFVEWAAASRMSAALHEQGLYAAPELKVCALALTTVMANHRYLRTNWERVRDNHAAAYITGHVPRAAAKIAERLGLSASTDEILPPALVTERIDRFCLPENFGTYHESLQEWAAANQETMQGSAAYPIFEAAQRAA